MKRVGIVGSRTYTNRRKIKEFVFKLKEQFQDKVETKTWSRWVCQKVRVRI